VVRIAAHSSERIPLIAIISATRIPIQMEFLAGTGASNIAQEAFDALRSAGITSARIGGIINDQGVVLVDGPDIPFALTMLERAGFTAVADSR
jgi:hypothetical protein